MSKKKVADKGERTVKLVETDKYKMLSQWCNFLEMRYEALLLQVTDSRMVDNAERIARVAMALERESDGLSIEEVFSHLSTEIRLQQIAKMLKVTD